MKCILIIYSLLLLVMFAKAAQPTESQPTFVYITTNGVEYQPDPNSLQPTVRVLDTYWGYDLKSGTDAEVCIVKVEELAGDSHINPPTGSFLVHMNRTYQLRSAYEQGTDCVNVGM